MIKFKNFVVLGTDNQLVNAIEGDEASSRFHASPRRSPVRINAQKISSTGQDIVHAFLSQQ